MAREEVLRFLTDAITDEALAKQVAQLAELAGYSFTAADLLELGAARPLSDEETAGAAAGADSQWVRPPKGPLDLFA